MIIRTSAVIDAPGGVVRALLTRTDIWTRAARACGARADVARSDAGPRAALRTGAVIRIRRSDRTIGGRLARLLPPRSLIMSTTVADGLPRFDLMAGPPRSCTVEVATERTESGTLVTVECHLATSPRALTALYRRRALDAGQLLLGIIRLAA